MKRACVQLSAVILIPVSSSRFSIPRNLSAGITIEPLGQVYFVRRPSLLSEMLQQLEWLSWTSLCRSACFDQHRNSVLECLNVVGMDGAVLVHAESFPMSHCDREICIGSAFCYSL